MIRQQHSALWLLAVGMIGLGLLSVISRDFAFGWQPVPQFHPGREALAVVCGLFMILVSVALLFRAIVALATRAVFLFLIAWLCLKIPAVIAVLQIEGVWIGFGEIGMLLAGGWVLFAHFSGLERRKLFERITGQRGTRLAQILFGLAIIPVGLGHIFDPSGSPSPAHFACCSPAQPFQSAPLRGHVH